MTPLERLLAEELPTGTFGDAPDTRTTPARAKARRAAPVDTAGYTVRNPISPEQAAANQQALRDAIDPSRIIAARHLRVVTTATAMPIESENVA